MLPLLGHKNSESEFDKIFFYSKLFFGRTCPLQVYILELNQAEQQKVEKNFDGGEHLPPYLRISLPQSLGRLDYPYRDRTGERCGDVRRPNLRFGSGPQDGPHEKFMTN